MKPEPRLRSASCVGLLLAATAALPALAASGPEEPMVADSVEHRPLISCPSGLDQWAPSRTVLQVIDLEVHRWHEYDFEDGTRCIVQERPGQKVLTRDEAVDLLARSKAWVEQKPDMDNLEVLPADAPQLDAPPASPPDLIPPGDRSDPEALGPDSDHLEPDPPERDAIVRPARDVVEPDSVDVPTVVIGDDERVRRSLSQVQSHPWNTIGYHRHQYPNLATRRCTAFLVGPNLALTNAHCVYNEDRGGLLRAAEFSPGQYQSGQGESVVRPFGMQPVYRFRVNQQWIDGGGSIYDYAGLNLSRTFDGITTFMPLVFDDPGAQIMNTSGYPAHVHLGTADEESPTFAQWYSSSTESSTGGTSDRLLYHDADTSGGHSGSPLWRFLNPDRRIIAVHCCGSSSAQINWGPRLVSQNLDVIEGWLDWTPPATPTSADDFGEVVLPATGQGSIAASNVGATLQIGEPDHCDFPGGRSMWWSWTAPVDRGVTFHTSDTDMDVLLAAYTGSAVNGLNEVACDGSAGSNNSIAFEPMPGSTYHLAVDGYQGDEDEFTLNWTVEPPDNDDFEQRRPMSGNSGSDSGDNWGATPESAGFPAGCVSTDAATIWWSFVTDEHPGELVFDSQGSDLDVLLAVYTGDEVGTLEEVACSDSPGSNNSLSIEVDGNTAYHLVVAGRDAATGPVTVNWSFEEQPWPEIDSVSPPSGPDYGGTEIVISGQYFADGAQVTLGGSDCEDTEVVSSTTISCTVPPAQAGVVDVTVVNPDDRSVTLAEGFVYLESTGPVFGDRFENRTD